MHDLIIPVGEILGRPGEFRDFHISAPLPDAGVALARVSQDGVTADLRAESVVEGVLITGRLGTDALMQCSRCLVELSSPLALEICELFSVPGHGDPDDDYRLDGLDIDLAPMLRDAVTLALPFSPLCRDDCRGLCAHCGQDLNATQCDCTDEAPDPRWAELDALKERLQA